MIIEESEAFNKYCCKAWTHESRDKCKGSNCMAWKWIKEYNGVCGGKATYRNDTKGYCGLAYDK